MTKQAFIIMQIGNEELDQVCNKAIVPALKSCAFDPKRVDKHNEGRLLKSEIVKFIESSDIIIADLTNERPNCYLEIGYAMGLDKFRNLILTAREDHHHENPNYRKGGPKIHFDLSGYDILFWNPKNLDKFKDELEKRIKRRIVTLPSYVSLPAPLWDEDWISKHRELALAGLKKCKFTGYMEIRSTLRDYKPNISQEDLLDIARKSQIHTFGWPIGVVLDRQEARPKPKTDGIVAEIESQDGGSYDYWSIGKNGNFYLLASLFEDMRKPGHIFFNTRIVRVTETLLYLARFYSGIKAPPDSPMSIGIRHGGLKDRILTAAGRRHIFHEYKSIEDEIYAEVETSLDRIEPDLVDLLQKIVQPLFVVFDYFSIDRNILEEIVNNYVAGKVV